MKAICLTALAVLFFAAAVRAEQASGSTAIEWTPQGKPPVIITLYGDGTFANAAGQKKNYRWAWTDEGLLLKFWTARYIFRPVAGEPGRFSGQLVRTKPDQEAVAVQISVEGPDGAAVLAWLSPIIDGPRPSAIERLADAQAQQVALGKLRREIARVDAAAEAAEQAEQRLDWAGGREANAASSVQYSVGALGNTRHRAQEAKQSATRLLALGYPATSFVTALESWHKSGAARDEAETALDHAREALASARDAQERARAELRKTRAEHSIALADFQIAYLTAWRPIYLQRKSALKAESARRLLLPRPGVSDIRGQPVQAPADLAE